MIGYTMVGTNDLDAAATFYDALFGEAGGKRVMENERMVLWGWGKGAPMFGVVKPFDGNPATVGNGTMIAILADTQEQVRNVFDKAMELGGTDEGAPGWRGDPGGFYGAYFRDLDGNKLCVYRIGPE